MSAPDEYCDFCDLPLSQCIHGRPPTPAPVQAAKAPPKPMPKKAPVTRRSAPGKVVTRRWTQPEALKPLILAVLTEAGGELDAEDLFLQLEIALDDRLLPGDRETTPEGELRWRYAARRARVGLIEEGLMAKTRPGVWELA